MYALIQTLVSMTTRARGSVLIGHQRSQGFFGQAGTRGLIGCPVHGLSQPAGEACRAESTVTR